ncbi:MAG: secretin N-terminal domain-containing protein [Limisphaerales bacterium]
MNKKLFTLLTSLCLGAVCAEAQNPPTTQPPGPQGRGPGGPAAAAPMQRPAAPPEVADIKLNFKDTPLSSVLEYLSKEAGFAIIKDAEVLGNVDAISAQPLTKTEAFDMLNSILYSKGYTAIRNGRILTIVNSADAKRRNIPVKQGAVSMAIPPNDEMVTQIIPIRYANASQLVQNLQPLLDEEAVIAANESSNALILTDTQANIRRVVQIVEALDTSISGITAMRVYPLSNATATEAASIINEVMGGGSSNNRNSSSSRGGSSSGGDIRSQIMSRIQSRMGGGTRR